MKVELNSKQVAERIINQLMDEGIIPDRVDVCVNWKVSLPAPGASTGEISLSIEVGDAEDE